MGRVVIAGDMNMRGEEGDAVCKAFSLKDARYDGFSWGARGNKFFADREY